MLFKYWEIDILKMQQRQRLVVLVSLIKYESEKACEMFWKYRTSANLFGNRIKMILDEMWKKVLHKSSFMAYMA